MALHYTDNKSNANASAIKTPFLIEDILDRSTAKTAANLTPLKKQQNFDNHMNGDSFGGRANGTDPMSVDKSGKQQNNGELSPSEAEFRRLTQSDRYVGGFSWPVSSSGDFEWSCDVHFCCFLRMCVCVQIQGSSSVAFECSAVPIATQFKCYLFGGIFGSGLPANGFGRLSNTIVVGLQKCRSVFSVTRWICEDKIRENEKRIAVRRKWDKEKHSSKWVSHFRSIHFCVRRQKKCQQKRFRSDSISQRPE